MTLWLTLKMSHQGETLERRRNLNLFKRPVLSARCLPARWRYLDRHPIATDRTKMRWVLLTTACTNREFFATARTEVHGVKERRSVPR